MTAKKQETVFKCTRPDGTDFRTGKVNYAEALKNGKAVEILDAAPANGNVCGHGIHVSPTARKTIQFAEREHRPWRWFEGTVEATDIIERDMEKLRVKRFTPTKELTLTDIFGSDLADRVQAVRESIVTWKTIRWLKPAKAVTDKTVSCLIAEWREALQPWSKKKLASGVRIVHTADAADADAAADAAADADADAAADAATAAVADAAVADAAADAATAAVADAAVADADAAAAAAADADADAARRRWRYYFRWYVRPYYVLRRDARWKIAGMPGVSPWAPLIELYKLGCMPIGYVKGKFVVYVPKATEGKDSK